MKSTNPVRTLSGSGVDSVPCRRENGGQDCPTDSRIARPTWGGSGCSYSYPSAGMLKSCLLSVDDSLPPVRGYFISQRQDGSEAAAFD